MIRCRGEFKHSQRSESFLDVKKTCRKVYYCDVQVQSFLRTKAPNNVLAKKKSKSIIEGNRFIYTPDSNLVIKSKLLDVKKVFDSKTKVEHSS